MEMNACTSTSRRIQSYLSAMTTMRAFVRKAHAAIRGTYGESSASSTWLDSVLMVETARMGSILRVVLPLPKASLVKTIGGDVRKIWIERRGTTRETIISVVEVGRAGDGATGSDEMVESRPLNHGYLSRCRAWISSVGEEES